MGRETPYGKLVFDITLHLREEGDTIIGVQNPLATLHRACAESKWLARCMRQAFAKHECTHKSLCSTPMGLGTSHCNTILARSSVAIGACCSSDAMFYRKKTHGSSSAQCAPIWLRTCMTSRRAQKFPTFAIR